MRLIPLLALITLIGCSSPPVEKAETEAPVPVEVETVKAETITATVATTGVVTPAPGGDWTLVAPMQGRILEITKAENDPVRQGEVLVRFDIPSLAADVAAKKAEITQATQRLTTAKAKVARLAGLQSQGVAAPREVEEAKQEQADAESTLAQAQSGLAAAQTMADRAVVTAKFDGVVAKRWHNAGESVDASATDPILRIINAKKLQVLAAVPMSQLARLATGHAATIVGPAGGDGVPGTVVAMPVQVDPASATADVRVAFAAPTSLPAGAVVQIEIVAEIHKDVIVVPSPAIVSEDNELFVMVAGDDKRAHKYPVVLGFESHGVTEIKNGLKAGQAVIVKGQDGLPDGGAIQIQK